MSAPQVVFIGMLVADTAIAMVLHGKPRGNYSFFQTLIAVAINVAVLWWGGFWA